jgi:hypothetical protein
MDELLRARLLAQIVNVPVDWGMTAQSFNLPRIVLYRISGGDDYTMTGRTGYTLTRVQVDCYAASVGAAKLLGRQVKTALSGYRSGAMKGVFLQSERDLPPDTDGSDTIARVSLDFFIHHQE